MVILGPRMISAIDFQQSAGADRAKTVKYFAKEG
jgi:hypothetical protein